jgi:hypothetical protein
MEAIEAGVIKRYGKVSAAMPKAQPYYNLPTSVSSPPSKINTSHVPLAYPVSSSKTKIIVGIDYGTTYSGTFPPFCVASSDLFSHKLCTARCH